MARRLYRTACFFLPALVAAAVLAAPVHAEQFHFAAAWGDEPGEGKLDRPQRVAVHGDVLYVLNIFDSPKIKKFTVDGKYLTSWGPVGNGPGMFSQPRGIAVDSAGYVYVSDLEYDVIQKFTPSGEYVKHWIVPNERRGFVGDLAFDASDVLYVERTGVYGQYVDKFTSDGSFIESWQAQTGRYPSIAINPAGEVVAASNEGTDGDPKPRVKRFTPSGSLIATWELPTESREPYPGVRHPKGIATDTRGNVYVTEDEAPSILMYAPSGELVDRWGARTWGKGEVYGGQELLGPDGIASDGAGNLYVLDEFSDRVLKFAPGPAPKGGPDGSDASAEACAKADRRLAKAKAALSKARKALAKAKKAGAGSKKLKQLSERVTKAKASVKKAKQQRNLAC